MQNFCELVPDPILFSYDISGEEEYLKVIITKLRELEMSCPNKKFAEIFYERYIAKSTAVQISNKCNISVEEIYSRIMELSRAVNKEFELKGSTPQAQRA